MKHFSELGLHPKLVQAVAELGYTTPTPIQTRVIPALLSGRDVIGQAQTGTGKTAGFALPMLQRIAESQGHANDGRVRALVLTPTRELAAQVTKSIYGYGSSLALRVLPVYGGQPYGRQISRLQKGVEIVVGTPGRLLDLLKRGALDLSALEILVLDEADEMLSMGFIDDIESILQATPQHRQTALFSATVPDAIARLARRYMQDPESISIERTQMTAAGVEERCYIINPHDKLAALTRLFETEDMQSALVFVRTRAGSGRLAGELTARGYAAEMINGDLSQDAREQAMDRFRRGQIEVLVATDVAARGIDIDDISHVFNYDLPVDVESYVHRVGRTGRAGRAGVAISLVGPKEIYLLNRIEGYTKQSITRNDLPSEDEIHSLRERRLVERLQVWLNRGRCNREKELVDQLAADGHDLLEIAAAALKMARSEEKQRPIEEISPVTAERPRHRRDRQNRPSKRDSKKDRRFATQSVTESHEAGMVRLQLDAGKSHGVRPRDVVGTIAYHADIPGKALGAIHIRPQHTLVDVPAQFVERVLEQDSYQIHRRPVAVERA